MEENDNKDKLRSTLIEELLTASNWFTLVAGEEGMRLFTCVDSRTLTREFTTIMLQQPDFAKVIIESLEEYVRIMNERELIKNINMN